MTEFYRLPGDRPDLENVLAHGELITAIEIPLLPAGARSGYLKVRDRASYEFALTSAAVALLIEDGVIDRGARRARRGRDDSLARRGRRGSAGRRRPGHRRVPRRPPRRRSSTRSPCPGRRSRSSSPSGRSCGRWKLWPDDHASSVPVSTASTARPRSRGAAAYPTDVTLPGSRTRGARAQHHRVRPGDRDRRRRPLAAAAGVLTVITHDDGPEAHAAPRSGCSGLARRRRCRTTASSLRTVRRRCRRGDAAAGRRGGAPGRGRLRARATRC